MLLWPKLGELIMKRKIEQAPDQNSLETYLNCASLAMFLIASLALIAAYSPMKLISDQAIEAATIGTPRLFLVPLLGALVISGIQISKMWSTDTSPSVTEFGLFVVLHFVAFLFSYIGASLILEAFQSSFAVVLAIGFAMTAPMIAFIRIRNSNFL